LPLIPDNCMHLPSGFSPCRIQRSIPCH
jgi:hypothetical protein